MNTPTLRKARTIQGRSLTLRNATVADASFIFALRTDESLSQHLSKVSTALSDQIAWLERYAACSDEAYFIVEAASGDKLGTVRLYDAQCDSFCWGSWIIKDGAPQTAAIESALIVYSYAMDRLGFTKAHFQVHRDNQRVWAFHERFGAVRTREHGADYEYTISNNAITAAIKRYSRFLPDQILVEPLK